MRLLLQQRPLAGEPPKYVQLILQQDLLGGWQLLRESGQTGGKATLQETAPGVAVAEVLAVTEAELAIPDKVPEMNLS